MQRNFFSSFFLDKGKIQGYLPPNVGVPREGFNKKKEFFSYLSTCKADLDVSSSNLEKARENGQVARSQELSVAAMMIGVATFMYLF